MQEMVVNNIPLKLDVSSRGALIVALFGIAALWYIADRAMELGYEVCISEKAGLVIKRNLQGDNPNMGILKPQLKADLVLKELCEQEGSSSNSQELQVL